jgi:AcrR family transcriptional regulator
MTEVNVARAYHSPRRAEQAAATRSAIIAAAARLFAEHGYAATTMAAIAAEARVTPKSVYSLAEKPQLLLLAVDREIVGDDEPVPMADRPPMRALVDADDPVESFAEAARFGAETLLRLYPIYRAFEQAVGAEPALRTAWRDYQQRRRSDMRQLVVALHQAGRLRPGLSVERATDTVWAIVTWHTVALLAEEGGWGHAQLASWLEDLLTTLLTGPSRHAPSSP